MIVLERLEIIYQIPTNKKPTNVDVKNYNKIGSALNNYDPTPIVSSLVGLTFVEIFDSV